jgi:sterol desaturase/sphingolipid hydroxylase (fatty acid hydroxylase superfamily)
MDIWNVEKGFFFYWFFFCGLIMGGYLLAAFSVYHLLYSILGEKLSILPLKSTPKSNNLITEDIKLSILSGLVFALTAACFMVCYQRGYTQAYTQWNIHGLGYLIVSYIVVLLLQDTYFYFMHRISHHPFFFQWFHKGHHRSRPPTPWTFFALEPYEAIMQAVLLLGITLVMPLYLGVLIAVLLTMMTWAIGNHLGIAVVPHSFLSCHLGRWFIGSAHHLVHHRKLNRHYGLYFTFWDRLLGTQDPDYDVKRLSGSL